LKFQETKFKEKVQKDLKTLHDVFFFKSNEVALRGIPDFIICIKSKFIAIELKRDEKVKPEPLQLYILTKIALAGGKPFIAHPKNWRQIFEKLQKLAA
jgi:hypothetical protein